MVYLVPLELLEVNDTKVNYSSSKVFKMVRFNKPDADSVFRSPLGPYDYSQEKWDSLTSFLEDMFRRKHPSSQIFEVASGMTMTYSELLEVAETVAANLALEGKIVHVAHAEIF